MDPDKATLYINKNIGIGPDYLQDPLEFMICKKIKNKWYIMGGSDNVQLAAKARKTLMLHDLKTGDITTPINYRIFKHGLNQIQEDA